MSTQFTKRAVQNADSSNNRSSALKDMLASRIVDQIQSIWYWHHFTSSPLSRIILSCLWR